MSFIKIEKNFILCIFHKMTTQMQTSLPFDNILQKLSWGLDSIMTVLDLINNDEYIYNQLLNGELDIEEDIEIKMHVKKTIEISFGLLMDVFPKVMLDKSFYPVISPKWLMALEKLKITINKANQLSITF